MKHRLAGLFKSWDHNSGEYLPVCMVHSGLQRSHDAVAQHVHHRLHTANSTADISTHNMLKTAQLYSNNHKS
jgi:hypothetical protein